MKIFIFVFLLLFSCIETLFAQETKTSLIGNYYWTNEFILQGCDFNGKNLSDPYTVNALPDQLFSVIKAYKDEQKDTYVIIRFVDFTDQANILKYNFNGTVDDYNKSENDSKYKRYFKISVDDLAEAAKKYTYSGGGLASGIINFPFKFRLQKGGGDFANAFNLGAAVGYSIPHYSYRDFTYSILAAFNFSPTNLDVSSVSSDSASKLTTTNNYSALSYAVGGLVQYDKVQVGVFFGADRLSKLNNDTFHWIYQNKPWFSIGFGYNIFSTEKQSNQSGTQPK